MSDTSSNTNGTTVASVGFWGKNILIATISALEGFVLNFKRVLTGEVAVAAVDFVPKSTIFKLPDAIMAEIAQRLIITWERDNPGNVSFTVTPPDDKSKIWWQIDPVTNVPIGVAKQWDAEEEEWVPIGNQADPYEPPEIRRKEHFAPANASAAQLDFPDIGTDEYDVSITATTKLSGSWQPAPDANGERYGYFVTNKLSNRIDIAFYGIPEGGLMFEIRIEERVT